MKLEQLEIIHLPGLEEGFTIDFGPDAVNFITGPNASGKSSLIRAVRALLYPDQYPEFCHLRGRWKTTDRTLECERHGSAVTWLENHEPAPPPRLPGIESLGAYLVSSESLVDLGTTDAHIAAQVRTMLAGGYDLDALLATPPLETPARPQKKAREYSDLQQQIRSKEDEYASLREELDTLGQLQQDLAQTADAAHRLRACEEAIALAEAIARRTALEHTLIEEYPGGMDRLRGDELTRLDQVETQLEERRKERDLAHRSLQTAEAKLSESGTTDPHELEALQSDLAAQRDRLARLESRIDEQRAAMEQARRDQAMAARRLGETPADDAPVPDADSLERFERLVDRQLNLREKVRALSGELARHHVPATAKGHSDERLRRGRQALIQWLEFCRLSPLEGWLWGGLGAAGLMATWRVLGPRELEAAPELILLILLAVGVPAGLLWRFIERYRRLGRSRTDFEATDLEAPLGWTESEVESRLERLEQELQSASLVNARQERATEVREQLNQERDNLEKAREQLTEEAGKLGLSPENRMETGFLLWCRYLHDWQQAGRGLDQARRALEQALEQHRNEAAAARELIEQHGLKPEGTDTSRELSGLLHRLTPRMRAQSELINEQRQQQRRIEELDADIERLTRQHRAIYEQAGLEHDARDTLLHRIEHFEKWRSLEQQRSDSSLEVRRLEKRLQAEPDLLELARDQERDQLEQQRAELAEQATRRDELNQRIAAIKTRHEETLKRRDLEQMTGQLERQREDLESELDGQLLARAGQLLVADVRATHQADNEPATLARAGRWFGQFTRHRYQLHFNGQRFEAYDTRADRQRTIPQLSTATRMQLLLALRLAWIEQAELDSEPLPVFMDEVLTTSDPDRYQLVVEAVQDIARDGRQMFYLTAQSDEATAWAAWAGEGPSPLVIDLAEVRRNQVPALQTRMPKSETRRRSIPDPGDTPPEQWARECGVGAINPWAGSGQLHLFHLLRDRLELATRLMRGELERVGELGAYLDADVNDQLLDPTERRLLELRCRGAALVIEDWQSRHARPVDGAALQACGLISETFLPRVVELAEKLGGHPGHLVDALKDGQISRFRSDVTEQLEQWLADCGYLPDSRQATPITAAELASRTGMDVEEAATLRDWIISAINDPLAARPTEETAED
ncbi:AAA family ATPase [Wenzhouxiangella sp. AB-CW3]|uniref:AAA family ATPase n=1 Tax=Wenzhouxiangella sp. AB-CW3 TaxID=2771012 RepID=UPI00168BB535|nr:AAA family ATPase [Wenzhouxiangella sp. AB-CW3]QOC23120.1 AAA family ATPase [Wenzhouxiangella sp. AB-CW3]